MAFMKLSPNEQRIFDMVPNGGKKITTAALAKKFYDGVVPYNGQVIVSGIARALEKKTVGHPVRVKRSKRTGPHPINVWKEA